MNRYNPKSFNQFTIEYGLSHNTVSSIIEGDNQGLWISAGAFGVAGNGFMNYTGVSFIQYILPIGMRSLMKDNKGKIWFSNGQTGARRFDPNTGQTTIFRHTSRTENHLYYLWQTFEDSFGHIWFGQGGEGLSSYNPTTQKWTDFRLESGFVPEAVFKILEDKNGSLWLSR